MVDELLQMVFEQLFLKLSLNYVLFHQVVTVTTKMQAVAHREAKICGNIFEVSALRVGHNFCQKMLCAKRTPSSHPCLSGEQEKDVSGGECDGGE